MELGTYTIARVAFNQAKRLARIANEACYVIRLNKGWVIYYASDAEFAKHQPAQYSVVEP